MTFLQQILNGLVLGHAYALIAIGWTMLLGVARLVNFSHGQIYMIAAFVAWYLISRLGMPYVPAAAAAILSGVVIGLAIQRILMHLTLRQDLVSIMIATLGCGYVLHGVAGLVFGSTGQNFETPLSRRDIYWGDLWLTWQDVAIVIVSILFFLALRHAVEKTRLGRMIRMVAEDPPLAQLSGVNVRTIYLCVFAFEGAAVALAAVLVAPRAPILTSMGFEEAIATFVVVVLGGIGSIAGSYFAALALGLFTALFGAYVSPAYASAAAFAALTVMLVLRPGGFAATQGGR